jgi:hypothetical protein
LFFHGFTSPIPFIRVHKNQIGVHISQKKPLRAIATTETRSPLPHYMRQNEWIFQRTAAIGAAHRDE